jgi:hypothetical protein
MPTRSAVFQERSFEMEPALPLSMRTVTASSGTAHVAYLNLM